VALSLKPYIKAVFPFTNCNSCLSVLGIISQNDGVAQNYIVNRMIDGTRRKVGTALAFLTSHGFVVYEQSETALHNIRNAFGDDIEVKPKHYHLTFKGFLASLNKANLGDTYLMQKYLGMFPHQLKNHVLEFVRIDILQYVAYHGSLGIDLTNLTDVLFHMDDTIPNWEGIGLGSRATYFTNLEKQRTDLYDELAKNNAYLPFIDEWARIIEFISKKYSEKKIIRLLKEYSLDLSIKDPAKFMESMKDIQNWSLDSTKSDR
jgi:hypothetical protein